MTEEIRLDALAESLPESAFTQTTINVEKAITVWIAIIKVEISRLEGTRKIAIVMNAPTFSNAKDIDYFITNVDPSIVTSQWIVDTYSKRNWVEVFDREAKGWLGLKEYQTRGERSLKRHFILVFCAYTFIRTRILRFPQNREMSVLWHKLTGGLRRRWANKPRSAFVYEYSHTKRDRLNTFPEAKTAFRTAISYRFVSWLNRNRDVFTAYKASLGFVWA